MSMSSSSGLASGWGVGNQVGDFSFITGLPGASGKLITCMSCRQRKSKCDRLQPRCSTCSRLGLECKYPKRKRNAGGPKKRNIKDLEAKLGTCPGWGSSKNGIKEAGRWKPAAQLETQLVSESKNTSTITSVFSEYSAGVNDNFSATEMNLYRETMAHMNPSYDMPPSNIDFNATGPNILINDALPRELIELGLQERLPSQELMNELCAFNQNVGFSEH